MDIKIKITRKKIKNLILKVTPEGEIQVSAPMKISKSFIYEFLEKQKDWINKKLKEVKEFQKKQLTFSSGEEICFLGKRYILEVVPSSFEKVQIVNEKIYLYCLPSADIYDRRKVFEVWGISQLAPILKNFTIEFGKKIGYFPTEIKIKNMRSRWGSCNSNKKITTYNGQLIYKPIPVIEYVVLHELAHIPYPHHQKEFWNFVELYMPDWKERRKLLKEI